MGPERDKRRGRRRDGRRAGGGRGAGSGVGVRSGGAGAGRGMGAFGFGMDRAEMLWGAALPLMVFVAYWPVLFADFVWDDKAFLGAVPVQTFAGLADIWFNPSSIEFEGHYWPLVYTTFWLEHKLWGFNPVPFHITNLLLHSGVCILLWRLLQRLAVPGAWLIAALFALHPVHVEAVAWVIARKDLLATLFYLLAVGCWLQRPRLKESLRPQWDERLQRDKSSQRGESIRRGRRLPRHSPFKSYAALLACFVAGMLSKSLVVTLPAALLVLTWWKQGRVERRDVLPTLPLFAIGALIVAYDLSQYSDRAALDLSYSVAERVVMASTALWFYAGKLLWPSPLLAIYPLWDVSPTRLLNWLPLLAALALAAGLWLARHRIGRGPLAGALFFAITLSPMLGFGDNSFMQFAYAADRYQYLASTGLLAILTATAVTLLKSPYNHSPLEGESKKQGRSPQLSRWGVMTLQSSTMSAAKALASLLLLTYGVLTFTQAQVYQNETTLFAHVIRHNPDAYHVHFNYGNALMEAERYEEAAASLTLAAQRYPETVNIHINLGVVGLEMGSYEAAEAAFRKAIEVEPDNYHANQNLAAALRRQQRFAESLAAMQTAAALQPPSASHYYYMGRDAMGLEDREGAARYYRLALQQDPTHAEARGDLVFIYLDTGRYAEALQLDPNLPAALNQMAYDSFQAGETERALQLFRHTVSLTPNDANAHANLGATLAQSGQYEEALTVLQQALTLNPTHNTAQTNLEMVHQVLNSQQ